jgi:hypothetical protein
MATKTQEQTTPDSLHDVRTHFTLKLILIVIIILSCGILMVYHRNHLLWKYEEWQGNLHDVRAIPDGPMPELDIPDDWVECSLGRMTFRLPPEMVADKMTEKTIRGTGHAVVYQDEHRKINVYLAPSDNRLGLIQHPISGKTTTFPRTRLESYRTNADDFRWSMSPQEVQWHRGCMATRPFRMSFYSIESLFREDIDGILAFDKRNRHNFEWQNTSGTESGFIYFEDKDEKPDHDWMRRVCQSIEIVLAEE